MYVSQCWSLFFFVSEALDKEFSRIRAKDLDVEKALIELRDMKFESYERFERTEMRQELYRRRMRGIQVVTSFSNIQNI